MGRIEGRLVFKYVDGCAGDFTLCQSISQSLRRSLNTTITTCLALGVVCVVSIVFGLDSIYTFAVPLMAGMISGVYTSLCITTSLWAFWEHRKSRNPGKAAPRAKKA